MGNKMKNEMQKAQDVISALEHQRNGIANQLVRVQAELIAAERLLREKDEEIKALSSARSDDDGHGKQKGRASEEAHAPNGHAEP